MSGFTFHLPRSALEKARAGMKPFYRNLTGGLADLGHDVCLLEHNRDTALATVQSDQRFHVIDHGRIRHSRVLNAGIAYVYPFWNLDPWGIRAFSSIAEASFDPALVPQQKAQEFFGRLHHRLVKKRASRYPQPTEITGDLPKGSIAVFLQSDAHREVGETCYLSRRQMVETVLDAAGGCPVIVKPHPRDLALETFEWLDGLTRDWPSLTVSDANIHDILSVAETVVTINSAVGIEAYLHRVSVILCGHADFLHICHTARTPEDLAALLVADLPAQPVEAYLYWYFRQNCLAAGDPALIERFLGRVAQTGFAH